MWMKNILPRLLKHCSIRARFIIMMTLIKKKTAKSSSFADFMNNASSAQKKKLYETVLEKASDSQQRIVASARELRAN